MGILRSRTGNKRTVVTPNESTELTPYDPLRYLEGGNQTRVHASDNRRASTLRRGTVVRASNANTAKRNVAERGVALPRHDYENR